MYEFIRKISILILCAVALTNNANASSRADENKPYHFEITKDIYKFSEVYRIKSQLRETYLGAIKKSSFRVRTHYDLSNNQGWQATGIVRAVSLGALYSWAKDIDIYNTKGKQIGMIDGELATLESAKYSIYRYDNAGIASLVGIAYANANFTRFIIYPSNSDNLHIPIAELNRDSYKKNWVVSVHSQKEIDARIIRIFAGFVTDHQDIFLAEPALYNKAS